MKELFEQYITIYPFWGDFYASKVESLPPFYDRSLYLDLRKWYGNPSNKKIIEALTKKHSDKMKALQNEDLARFKEQKENLKFKVPSVENLSTYIGMFDEE
ncbi:hypothetical protein [Psychroserpens luteolus]|uniref:hypothetical protein n=1 Tax=Psychroserpens luteolus TaxID=2855840 RepID=UPI001E49D491|nr:hypothetical protein [Psychroserpens luteolus]MCD2258627.1 hypothetical protein [Psychroserpens luteolus]